MTACEETRRLLAEGGSPAGGEGAIQAHRASCEPCAGASRTLALVDRGLSLLSAEPPPLAPPFALIAAEAAAAARSQRRLKKARLWAPLAAAAGVSALVAGVAMALWSRAPAARLGPGESLGATSGASVAVLPSGARLTVSDGRVQLTRSLAQAPGEERLTLASGAVALEVPKLAPGHALVVETPDADVRVHGTRFRVTRESDGTRVAVTEGLVEVRPSGAGRPPTFLGAGQSMLAEPLVSYRARLRAESLAALERDRGGARASLEALLATEPPAPQAGDARALLAWLENRAGNRDAAASLYRAALADAPAAGAPLWAEDACAELALLEERSGGDAAAEWRECLRRFPSGTHAELARDRLARLGTRR